MLPTSPQRPLAQEARIFGVVGDSLNGLTDAMRKRKAIDWIHVRHEEVAAFAAAGEAQVTGEQAVCGRGDEVIRRGQDRVTSSVRVSPDKEKQA